MEIDGNRLTRYLDEVALESADIKMLIARPEEEILGDPHLIKSLKYSTIVVAEAIASALQHILAKQHNAVVDGYMAVFRKAEQYQVLPKDLILRLQPFLRFRNMLVHQYWRVENQIFLKNLANFLDIRRLQHKPARGSFFAPQDIGLLIEKRLKNKIMSTQGPQKHFLESYSPAFFHAFQGFIIHITSHGIPRR